MYVCFRFGTVKINISGVLYVFAKVISASPINSGCASLSARQIILS